MTPKSEELTKKNKSELNSKPKSNRNQTETETKPKPNRNHNQRYEHKINETTTKNTTQLLQQIKINHMKIKPKAVRSDRPFCSFEDFVSTWQYLPLTPTYYSLLWTDEMIFFCS